MGIQDRDYMKRPRDKDWYSNHSSPGNRTEEALSGFLRRHPKFFVYSGIGLGVLLVIALIVAVAS